MSQQTVHRKRLQAVLRVWIDALGYGVVLTVVATTVAVVTGIATGGGFVRGKILLFVTGWVLLAYATAKLWPSSGQDGQSGGRSLPGGAQATQFQTIVSTLPPLRWIEPPPPEDRMTLEGKLFLSGCLVLVVSFLMETWLGIQ